GILCRRGRRVLSAAALRPRDEQEHEVNRGENGSRRLCVSFRRAARESYFHQANQNHGLALASPRSTYSWNSWNCSQHSATAIYFSGTSQKITTANRRRLPRFARRRSKRIFSGARTTCRPK